MERSAGLSSPPVRLSSESHPTSVVQHFLRSFSTSPSHVVTPGVSGLRSEQVVSVAARARAVRLP